MLYNTEISFQDFALSFVLFLKNQRTWLKAIVISGSGFSHLIINSLGKMICLGIVLFEHAFASVTGFFFLPFFCSSASQNVLT